MAKHWKYRRFRTLLKLRLNRRYFQCLDKDFIEWLNTGSIDDLNATLKAFEDVQMYESCTIIAKVLNEKINSIVTIIEHD